MTYRVFISGTSKDLTDYRKAAIETRNKLHLLPVDMTCFNAMGGDGTASSLQQLRDSDVYVGIVAHRWGRVTQEEFRSAGELPVERLCFLVDDGHAWRPTSTACPGNWPHRSRI